MARQDRTRQELGNEDQETGDEEMRRGDTDRDDEYRNYIAHARTRRGEFPLIVLNGTRGETDKR
jgi:predicted NUDIX family phosphoesterase